MYLKSTFIILSYAGTKLKALVYQSSIPVKVALLQLSVVTDLITQSGREIYM